MRLLVSILLCVLWLCTSAQSSQVGPTAENKTKRWRLGFTLHRDNGRSNPYLRSDILILPHVTRNHALVFVADFQIFRSMPIIFATTAFGHYRVMAGNDDFRWLAANNWPGDLFFESVQMNYAHFGLGLRIEPFARHRFSPYLGWQLQYAFPSQLEYTYNSFTPPGFGPLDEVEIKGGEEITRGWKLNFGLRAQLLPRWSASIGIYHVYMDFLADWPNFEQRPFLNNNYMRQDGGGVELRCQYSL